MKVKKCGLCKEKLSLSFFGKHKSHKDGHQSFCKSCKAKRDKSYYEKNKDKKSAYDKKRREDETQDERDMRNKRRRKLYAKNPTNRKISNSKWKKQNPEKVRIQVQRRRARIRNAKGEFTAEDWIDIKKNFDHKCAYCGMKKSLTVDHVIPLSKGGRHDKDNIVPACINCNSSKHISIWEYTK